METSEATRDEPMPVVPLNYQKPLAMPWRPVRVAMGVYLLTAGASALSQFILPLAGGIFRSFGGGPILSIVAFLVYVSSGVLFTIAGIGFLTSTRWRGTCAVVAQIVSASRSPLQLYSFYIYQSRTTVPPGYWWQMAGSWASSVLIPLSMLFFIIMFNRYDRAQDEPPTWT